MSPGAAGCEVRAGGAPLFGQPNLGKVLPDDQAAGD
jgi:hypothetical protein